MALLSPKIAVDASACGLASSCSTPRSICASARSARAAAAISELGVRLQVQQFLDDWHYNAVHSWAAKSWDHKKALRAALDLLEINGVLFEKGDKEKCLSSDEEAVVDCIVRSMPPNVHANFERISQQLQNALSQISLARRALEAGEEEGVRGFLEVDDDMGISRKVLRNAVVVASKEVAKTIDTHGSWRQRTEERIVRLSNAADEAEYARQMWLATETQISGFGKMRSEKARACLMGLAAGQDEAVMHASFAVWHGALEKAKADKERRQKQEEELRAAEERLFKLKERQLASVRATLMRQAREITSVMLRQCFDEWLQLREDSRREGITAENLREAQRRLLAAEQARKTTMVKVVSRMCADSMTGALQGAFVAWQQGIEESKKDRELEGEAKKVEEKVKEHLATHKLGTTGVFERLGACSSEGLLATAMAAWLQQVEEDKKAREMQQALDNAGSKLTWVKDFQMRSAIKAQARINRQVEFFVCMRVLNTWLLGVKAERVSRHFNKKLDSKRKQLNGVQTLFKTFAQQLEQGLGGLEDGEESQRVTNIKPMPRKSSVPRPVKRSSRGDLSDPGFQKGNKGTFSLPDIRKPPMWEEETTVRRER